MAAQREKERIESEADARARRRGGKSDALGMASIRSAADRRRSNNDSDSDSDIDWVRFLQLCAVGDGIEERSITGEIANLECIALFRAMTAFLRTDSAICLPSTPEKEAVAKRRTSWDTTTTTYGQCAVFATKLSIRHIARCPLPAQDDSEFGFGSNAAASKFLGKIGRKKSADGIFNDEDGADLPETGDGENVSEFLSAADKKLAALESGTHNVCLLWLSMNIVFSQLYLTGVEESTKKSRSPRRRKSGSPRRKQESSVVQRYDQTRTHAPSPQSLEFAFVYSCSTSTSVSESVFEGVKEKKKKKSVEIDIDVNEYVAKHDRRAQDSDSDEDMF